MPNRRLRAAGLGAAIVFAGLLAAGCGQANNTANQTTQTNQTVAAPLPKEPTYSGPIVATYQGGKLTKEELDQQYNLMLLLSGTSQGPVPTKRQFLNMYVTYYKYLYGKAAKAVKTPPSASEVGQMTDQEMQQLQTQFKSQKALQDKMKSLGVTKDDLTLYFEKYQILMDYIQQQVQSVKVTDKEALAYYNAHKPEMVKVTVDHILVDSLEQAKQIEAQLKAGANFAKLADKYSKDPGVSQNHGRYANSPAYQFVSQFAQACGTLPIGQISDPVHTRYGYHIMKVESRTPLTFDQVKSDLKQQLLQTDQTDKQKAILNDAVQGAKIKVLVKDAEL